MKIYHDGLERSGNIYFSHCLGMTLEIELHSLRTHDIKTLQEYNQPHPFIVSVRDALPSIASSKVFRGYVAKTNFFEGNSKTHAQTHTIIARYKAYMEYLLDNEKFIIAPFHEFTKDHNAVIDKILKLYPEIQVRKRFDTYEDIMNNANHNDDLIFHPHMGNFPREAVPERQQAEELLLNNYMDDINEIQFNIDRLYERYYNI